LLLNITVERREELPTMPQPFHIGIVPGTSLWALSGLTRQRARRIRDWARTTEEALRPFSQGAHILAALDADDLVHTAFGANLPRLGVIKGKYDPTNFFRVNQNIKPVLAQATGD
jgi:hypothetical protein